MAFLGTAEDYQSVRAALDVTLTEDEVPDYVVALPIFQGAAEAELVARDPLAAGRTGADALRVRRAAMYLTAALLAPALPRITAEQLGPGVNVRREYPDATAQTALLRRLADEELTVVLGEAALVAQRPVMFALATAARGY